MVNDDKSVDLPTDGNPIIQTLALPTLYTSKPSDLPPAKLKIKILNFYYNHIKFVLIDIIFIIYLKINILYKKSNAFTSCRWF